MEHEHSLAAQNLGFEKSEFVWQMVSTSLHHEQHE